MLRALCVRLHPLPDPKEQHLALLLACVAATVGAFPKVGAFS